MNGLCLDGKFSIPVKPLRVQAKIVSFLDKSTEYAALSHRKTYKNRVAYDFMRAPRVLYDIVESSCESLVCVKEST